MPAGQLRERVTFRRQVADAGDGAGNYGSAFSDITGATRIHAGLTPLSQAEVVLSQGVSGRQVFEVIVRYSATLAAITVGDKMVDARDATRTFNVKSPPMNVDKHRRYLKLIVEQGGADG